jgi:hypothetical protein
VDAHETVFIDESGDPGAYWKRDASGVFVPTSATRTFTVAGLSLPWVTVKSAESIWKNAAEETGRGPTVVVRWRKVTSPQDRMLFANTIRELPSARVFGYSFIKSELSPTYMGLGSEVAYLFAIERLVGAVRRTTAKTTTLEFVLDHFSQLDPAALQGHLMAASLRHGWKNIVHPVTVSGPRDKVGLQIADAVNGAYYAARGHTSGYDEPRLSACHGRGPRRPRPLGRAVDRVG